MDVVKGRDAIRAEYRKDEVADGYISGRFESGSGASYHEQQLKAINRIIALEKCKRLLEVAPGPGRVTAELKHIKSLIAIEQSLAMVRNARRRMRHTAYTCQFVLGDGFELPLAESTTDFAMSFRFIRHFELEQRSQLYTEFKRVLRPNGAFVIDVPNQAMYRWWFQKMGIEGSRVVDYWFDEASFKAEMRQAGFQVVTLYPVNAKFKLQYYINAYGIGARRGLWQPLLRLIDTVSTTEPLEWVAHCKSV